MFKLKPCLSLQVALEGRSGQVYQTPLLIPPPYSIGRCKGSCLKNSCTYRTVKHDFLLYCILIFCPKAVIFSFIFVTDVYVYHSRLHPPILHVATVQCNNFYEHKCNKQKKMPILLKENLTRSFVRII